MAGYIGPAPVPQATQNREAFTATSGQTSFATAGYTPQFIDVYLNGVKLAAADYTATNGSDVVLASGAASGDILEVVAFSAFTVADQAFTGTTTAANLTVTGAFTSQGIDDNADAVAITIDSSENVGIGTSNPAADFHVNSGASNLVGLFESTDAGATITLIDNGTTGGSAAEHGLNTVGDQLEIRAVDNLSFETGGAGSERMRIDSSGNVGIAATPPTTSGYTNLTLGASTTGSQIRLYGATSGFFHRIINNNGDLSIQADADNVKASTNLTFSVDGSEAMRISGGNLILKATSDTGNRLQINGADETSELLEIGITSGYAQLTATHASGGSNSAGFIFRTRNGTAGTNEKMRLDASGNLLVGKTSTATGAGFEARSDGQIVGTRSSNRVAFLNRLTSDGDIVQFAKDGTTVGGIGVYESDRLYIADQSNGLQFDQTIIRPCNNTGANTDDVVSLGGGGSRFRDLYLSGGVFLGGTSNENHLDDYEDGSWTPDVAGTIVSSASGFYTKVGHMVTAQFRVTIASTTSTSNAVLSGLPFAPAANTTAGRSIGFLTYNPSGINMTLLLNSGTTGVGFRATSNGASQGRDDISGNSYWGTLLYRTSA